MIGYIQKFYQKVPIYINIGLNKGVEHKNAPEKYALVVKETYPYVRGYVVNVSSPNTQKLRNLQDYYYLSDILEACLETMDKVGGRRLPIYPKVSPDSNFRQINDVLRATLDTCCLGVVATNTTANEEIKAKYGENWKNTPGGLSGNDPDFRRMSTKIVAYIRKSMGKDFTIIGVGGVNSPETAWEKITAGANAVELVTALRGEGPSVVGKINRGLVKMMDERGVRNINNIVGIDCNRYLNI